MYFSEFFTQRKRRAARMLLYKMAEMGLVAKMKAMSNFVNRKIS